MCTEHCLSATSPAYPAASLAPYCCCCYTPQDLKFVGMMQYDGDLLLPANFLVPPPEIHKTSGEFLVHNGISTFACSETQKFGHVTFFWNGNRSGYFDSNLETYLEVGAAAAALLLGTACWCSLCRSVGQLHARQSCKFWRCLLEQLAGRWSYSIEFNAWAVHSFDLQLIGIVCVLLPLLLAQIPSDKVPFNQAPDMKAYEITEAGKEALRSGKYKMVSTRGAGRYTGAVLA